MKSFRKCLGQVGENIQVDDANNDISKDRDGIQEEIKKRKETYIRNSQKRNSWKMKSKAEMVRAFRELTDKRQRVMRRETFHRKPLQGMTSWNVLREQERTKCYDERRYKNGRTFGKKKKLTIKVRTGQK